MAKSASAAAVGTKTEGSASSGSAESTTSRSIPSHIDIPCKANLAANRSGEPTDQCEPRALRLQVLGQPGEGISEFHLRAPTNGQARGRSRAQPAPGNGAAT